MVQTLMQGYLSFNHSPFVLTNSFLIYHFYCSMIRCSFVETLLNVPILPPANNLFNVKFILKKVGFIIILINFFCRFRIGSQYFLAPSIYRYLRIGLTQRVSKTFSVMRRTYLILFKFRRQL